MDVSQKPTQSHPHLGPQTHIIFFMGGGGGVEAKKRSPKRAILELIFCCFFATSVEKTQDLENS